MTGIGGIRAGVGEWGDRAGSRGQGGGWMTGIVGIRAGVGEWGNRGRGHGQVRLGSGVSRDESSQVWGTG